MDQLDETIHQPVRQCLERGHNLEPNREAIEFVRLRAIVGATEGNLGAHLTTLEKCGYVEITKDFVGKKPRTRIAMTPSGRRAFERYVDYLRGILDGSA
jgi:DNA-binding MarR family transcriptional regulator